MILFYSSLLVRCSAMCGGKTKLLLVIYLTAAFITTNTANIYMMNFNEIPSLHRMHYNL